ncbi:MAG: alpha/beta hydrolase [Chitinophagales bacterium]
MSSSHHTQKDYQYYFKSLAHKLGLENLIDDFEEGFIYSDGIKIHLDIIETDANAPTVVFIPGTAVYSLCYAELLATVAAGGYNVIGFDPRGHGRSGGKRGDYTIEELMRDTQNVVSYAIEQFNSEVSLLGSSQGGITAFYVAAIDDRIKSAVCQNFADLSLSETACLSRLPWLTRLSKPLLSPITKLIPNISIPIASYIDLSKEKVKHFGTVSNFLKQDPLAIENVSLRALHSLSTCQLPKAIEKIDTPLMIIQPGKDNIFPVSYTRKLFAKLKCKKRLEIFSYLSHTLFFDNVNVVAPSILRWLDNVHEIDKKDDVKIVKMNTNVA